MKIANDQNSICFEEQGLTVKFFPVLGKVKKNHCTRCLLLRYPGIDCTALGVPCRAWERKDKKDGVFSIREMPVKLKTKN
jgi:hypothetical protein